jgi:hypothetical protein
MMLLPLLLIQQTSERTLTTGSSRLLAIQRELRREGYPLPTFEKLKAVHLFGMKDLPVKVELVGCKIGRGHCYIAKGGVLADRRYGNVVYAILHMDSAPPNMVVRITFQDKRTRLFTLTKDDNLYSKDLREASAARGINPGFKTTDVQLMKSKDVRNASFSFKENDSLHGWCFFSSKEFLIRVVTPLK